MAYIHGKNILLEYGVGDPLEWTPFLCGKSADITLTAELLKKTDTVNGKFASFIPVGISGSMTASGLVKFDDTTFDVVDMILDQTELRVRFTINSADGMTEKNIQASGFIQTTNISGGVFALAEQQFTIQLSGIIET